MPPTAGPQDAPADIWSPLQPIPAEYDALADLFLSDDRRSIPEAPPLPAPVERAPYQPAREAEVESSRAFCSGPQTELLMLGHLPTYAPAWPPQYARALAADLAGPVALVRSSAGDLSVEHYIGRGRPTVEPAASAGAALTQAFSAASRVLVRVDEIDEPLVARGGHVGAVTLLCGADGAAVVSAYRAIKGLMTETGTGCDHAPPEPRIAFMGAEPAQAQAAFARIERATRAFLGRAPALAAIVGRIAPAQSATLYRGRGPDDLIRALGEAREHSSAESAPATEAPVFEQQRPAAPAHAEPAPPAASRPAAPKPASVPALAAWLEGVTSTRFRCPEAPGVEVGIDHRGALRLLIEAGPAAAQSLLVARAWALRHADLLAAALASESSVPVDVSAPAMHVFCRRVEEARDLARVDLRVHVISAGRRNPAEPSAVCLDMN